MNLLYLDCLTGLGLYLCEARRNLLHIPEGSGGGMRKFSVKRH